MEAESAIAADRGHVPVRVNLTGAAGHSVGDVQIAGAV